MEKRYCKLCGKELTEKQIKRDKHYCGRKCALKVAYQNPEVRQKVSSATKAALNRPETKQKHVEALAKIRKSEQYHTNLSNAIKNALNRPETKEKLSKHSKELWQREDYRQLISTKRKEQWEKEEYRQRMSQAMSDIWKDPDYKAKTGKSISEALNKQEVKQRQSASIKAALARPESKQRQRIANKELANRESTKRKIIATKRKHQSFVLSNPEKCILQQLLQVFPDVIHQYYSEKYPYNCDFYIPSLDLYIEYHGTWTHGGRPFDKNDESCIEQLNAWKEKAKTSKFYQTAIDTWTDLDIRKRQCTIDNNLNWLCFYNWSQYEQWLSEVQNAK